MRLLKDLVWQHTAEYTNDKNRLCMKTGHVFAQRFNLVICVEYREAMVHPSQGVRHHAKGCMALHSGPEDVNT
jgi:hypothetical protein